MSKVSIECLLKLGVNLNNALKIGKYLKPMSCLQSQSFSERASPLPGWIYVISGYFVASVPIGDGNLLPMAVYGPKEWTGEEVILARQSSPLTLTAAVDVTCLVLPRMVFRSAITTYGDFSAAVVNILGTKSSRRTEELIAVRMPSLPMRVCTLLALLVETQTLIAVDHKVDPLNLSEDFALPVSQEVLSKICGVSRTVMSGYLQVLRDHGLVGLRYGEIRLESVRSWLNYLSAYRQAKSLIDLDGITDIARKIAAMEDVHHHRQDYKSTINGDFPGF